MTVYKQGNFYNISAQIVLNFDSIDAWSKKQLEFYPIGQAIILVGRVY